MPPFTYPIEERIERAHFRSRGVQIEMEEGDFCWRLFGENIGHDAGNDFHLGGRPRIDPRHCRASS